jgi:hypothetical protein
MKKTILITFMLAAMFAIVLNSCKKNSNQATVISVPPVLVNHPISDTTTGGAVSGTMLSGHTYHITRDLTVNQGDTLFLQPLVTVCMGNAVSIIVKGSLISLGTKDSTNSFTVCSGPAKINTIAQAESPSTDPAYNGGNGWWTGINCDTTCALLVLKWTHVDFTGAAFPVTENFKGGTQGGTSFGILFQNPNGDFIMEDSWMYGGIDDAVRIQNGRISLMRNTFEKMGYIGGDCLNAKSGSVGDMAYNLFVGEATNGTKASNKGGVSPECNINMYNNTYVDCGYRQAQTGRGGDINYEQGAEGKAYNNLIVNCAFGFRIVNNPIADTANCIYGYNYAYGDSVSIVEQFYPVGYITKPNAYVVPSPSSTNYVYDPINGAAAYNDASLEGQNNPKFVNFPLPEPGITHLYDINYVGSYDFHLQSGSPALGIGYTSFSPLNVISAGVKSSTFGPTVTPPSADMGCYPSAGGGNQH